MLMAIAAMYACNFLSQSNLVSPKSLSDFQPSQPDTVPALINRIISINGYRLVRSIRGSVNF